MWIEATIVVVIFVNRRVLSEENICMLWVLSDKQENEKFYEPVNIKLWNGTRRIRKNITIVSAAGRKLKGRVFNIHRGGMWVDK